MPRPSDIKCALLVLGAGLFLAQTGNAQISPGDLSRSHSFLEGVGNCTKCHELRAGPSVDKCLACHREIAASLENRRGYHYHSVSVGKKPCFECHSEHAGLDFDLIHWPGGIKSFRHADTGYDLLGKHAALECRACHKRAFIKEDLRAFQKEIDLQKTYLGLRAECLSCHVDQHRGQLPADCLRCHTYDAWKPASRFDHAQTKFTLAGRHRDVPCAKCHPTVNEASATKTDGPPYVKYAGIATASCGSCHRDAHAGRFGAACESCHRPTGWTEVVLTKFDHSQTRFPLSGKHLGVKCAKCHPALEHASTTSTKNKPFMNYAGGSVPSCAACHRDVHSAKLGTSCEKCHQTSDWKQVTLANFDHSRTAFPLKGRHAGVACAKCHGENNRVPKPASSACTDCHADRHRGQFANLERAGQCSSCHTEDGFVPARFTLADHARTRFPLADAHLAQPCIACHVETADSTGGRYRRYVFPTTSCIECHSDIHAGQFSDTDPRKSCENCHRPTRWADLHFDHDLDSRYRLEGAHKNVKCASCHVVVYQDGKKTVRYRALDTACKSCHPIENS